MQWRQEITLSGASKFIWNITNIQNVLVNLTCINLQKEDQDYMYMYR